MKKNYVEFNLQNAERAMKGELKCEAHTHHKTIFPARIICTTQHCHSRQECIALVEYAEGYECIATPDERGVSTRESTYTIKFYTEQYENGDFIACDFFDGSQAIGIVREHDNEYIKFHAAIPLVGQDPYEKMDFDVHHPLAAIITIRPIVNDELSLINRGLDFKGLYWNAITKHLGPIHPSIEASPNPTTEQSTTHQQTLLPVPKFGLQIITVSKEDGEVILPSSITPEQLSRVIARCADALRAEAER